MYHSMMNCHTNQGLTMASDPKLPIGTNYCKCPACGEYFGGVRGFDLHRRKDACIPPSRVSDRKNRPVLRLNERGYWVGRY